MTRTARWASITPPVTCRTSHVQAAVDGPDLPGYVRGLVAREEADDPPDLFRLAEPADGDLAAEPVHHLVRDCAEHFGGDVPGGDRVHGQPDPGAGPALGPAQLEHRL